MPAPSGVYDAVVLWLAALGVAHRTGRATLAEVVTGVLTAQSLRPACLMRTLLSAPAVAARQRYKRLSRAWDRPWLAPAWLTPRLVRAALALVAPDGVGPTAGLTHLVLDGVRLGCWEVLTVGVGWHGRVLPVGWAVLAYPWPRGRFTPTACALVRAVAAAWPADRPAHLVADRAFPSRPLFRALADAGWGYTVRLRAPTVVRVDGQPRTVRDWMTVGDPEAWTTTPVQYGAGARGIAGRLVIGRGLTVVPWHQRGPACCRLRAQRATARQGQLRRKHPDRGPDRSATTDAWIALLTTHRAWRAAVASYRRRWTTEGSYRDAQGGWDGRHGWELDRTVARMRRAAQVERVVGLWAVATLLQSWLGHQATQPARPPLVADVVRQWTTTGRLSVWARGQLALASPHLRPWVIATLRDGPRHVTPPAASAAQPPFRALAA